MPRKNEELTRDIQTNIGTITVIDTSRKNRPAGLRKPYEYVLPKAVSDQLYDQLRLYLKSKEGDRSKFQICSVWKKSVSKGYKMTVFILGYVPGATGGSSGVTKEEWDEVVERTQQSLTYMLGPDAKAYIDEYTEEDKFQLKFETYIAYQEML